MSGSANISASRDKLHSNFDSVKEQNRLKQSLLIGEMGNQTMDVIRTQGDIEGLKAQTNPDALAVAKKTLKAGGKIPTDDSVRKVIYLAIMDAKSGLFKFSKPNQKPEYQGDFSWS